MSLFHAGLQPALDANGDPISGATWNFYLTGTDTPAVVYSTGSLATSLGAVVTANSAGRFANIFLDDGTTYRAVLKDSVGATIKDVDGVNGATGAFTVTPFRYGAVGDGETNDTMAFQAMAEAITAAGGGVIEFEPNAIYVVGIQAETDHVYYLTPELLLDFQDVPGSIIIRMNGATMKCAPGLKYGSFNPATGIAHPTVFPFNDLTYVATPYLQMMNFEGCTGPIVVENGILDGNIENQVIGGGYDDTGTQISMTGLFFKNCTGKIVVRNIESHHHGLDGVTLDGPTATANAVLAGGLFEDVDCHNNGRQGWSVTGGGGFKLRRCKGRLTGYDIGDLSYSPPGAGIDFEAEGGKLIRDFKLEDCDFAGNRGVGVLTVGNVANIDVTDSRIHGEAQWSLWPAAPYMRFTRCLINGAMVNLNVGSAEEPLSMVQFLECVITNDATLTASGTVYSPGDVIISGSSTHLVRCEIIHTTAGSGSNGSVNGGLYENCVIRATAGGLNLYGRFVGTETYFISDGGTVSAHPGGAVNTPYSAGAAGINYAGDAYDPFYVVTGGVATKHAATRNRSRLFTDAATLTLDFSVGTYYHVTLGGNRTLGLPTGIFPGQSGRIRVIQDATGSRTLAYHAVWDFPGGAPTLTTAANAVDVITFYVHTATQIEARIEKALA